MSERRERLLDAWLWACGLDVAVRKAGNVSAQSAGHGMAASAFLDSARAAAPAIAGRNAVGESIEAAVRATRDAAGCNTNLGIVLLCVPLARAWQASGADSPDRLLATLAPGLAALDLADAEAAYRAIAVASPGGLGQAPAEDVADAPSVDLRAAMTLAAGRDSVARQYRDGFADILGFGIGEFLAAGACEATLGDAVQRLHTAFLARWPDSHIVRKLGGGVAQTVTAEAAGWLARFRDDPAVGRGRDYGDWDNSLKQRGINPGTSADMTVATLFAAALMWPRCVALGVDQSWHGFCISSPRTGSHPASTRPDPLGAKSG